MKKIEPARADTDDYHYPLHMLGTATTLPDAEQVDEIVRRLHEVVREVTGREVVRPAKPRMGFI